MFRRKGPVRPTPRMACPRCRARATHESWDGVPVSGAIMAYDARCAACGATWKNLDASA